jgi:hypothetical protein
VPPVRSWPDYPYSRRITASAVHPADEPALRLEALFQSVLHAPRLPLRVLRYMRGTAARPGPAALASGSAAAQPAAPSPAAGRSGLAAPDGRGAAGPGGGGGGAAGPGRVLTLAERVPALTATVEALAAILGREVRRGSDAGRTCGSARGLLVRWQSLSSLLVHERVSLLGLGVVSVWASLGPLAVAHRPPSL